MDIVKKITFVLVVLFSITYCSNNEKIKTIPLVECFNKIDTLKMNSFETVGCLNNTMYQFLNDSTALTIEFNDQFLSENTCKKYDLVKDFDLIKIYIYEFVNLDSSSMIQMPLCTDIIISNTKKPKIRRPVIISGNVTVFRNSTCGLSFLMNYNFSNEDELKEQVREVSGWNINVCDVPG